MESISNLLNDGFEIIVCDNCSNDGSKEVLQEYAKKGRIKLIVERSSRGKGRQIAFDNSTGKYIISGLDTDDKLKQDFLIFLKIYHRYYENEMLSAGTIHIIPRKLVKEIGGWRDLKYGEDVDFHKRAKFSGRQHELEYPLILVQRGNNKRTLKEKVSEMFNASRCWYKIGKSVSDQVKMSCLLHKPIVLVFAISALIECKSRRVQKFRYPKTKGAS
jgi:glycosyltransferase involved in cell wall biosynthesis